jgi:subtilisin family serine protease
MAIRSYTILRDARRADTSDPFRPHSVGPTLESLRSPPEPQVETAALSARDVRDAARDPTVAAIAPVMPTSLIRPFAAEAEAGTTAWGISAVKADESPFTGTGVTVAVLDTGVEAAHPAFAGVSVVEEDFSSTGNGDRQGHGTHCAGTILGREVQGTRIGVATGVTRLLAGKVLGDDGGGDSDMIFRGIQWALQQNADVISMSLGFDFPGMVQRLVGQSWPADLATSLALEAYRGNLRMFDALMEMVEARAAFGQGTVLVAAAGNESRREVDPNYEIAVSIPAAAQGIVAVGALAAGTGGLTVAPFSNTFPQVSAPGVAVMSAALGGGLRALSGTSMATPHVAGVAALWWETMRAAPVNPSAMAVTARLLSSTRTGGFADGTDPADRGLGIVTAPLAAVS